MIIIKHIAGYNQHITSEYNLGKTVGFVPTMGALHPGHISLVNKSKSEQDITVASIFINPTQFNNAKDFEKYPVTMEKDIEMLEAAGCDILFLPFANEIYHQGEMQKIYQLGYLEEILEGQYRSGHFQGVCQVVDKLLNIINPSALYLGIKDYQQCKVIEKMISLTGHNLSLILCETVREAGGLAMSSRNLRLTDAERKNATTIIDVLKKIKATLLPGSTEHLTQEAITRLEKQGFKVDYISIADAKTLEPVGLWDGNKKIISLAAAYLNEIRLIDNLALN
ncbi:MAG: pantoate--beta-alanine ligase [Ferruginibacter sp.]